MHRDVEGGWGGATRRDVGLLASRLAVAGIFLWHGVPKALDWGAAYGKFVGFGLPGALGPVTGIAEVFLAGLLILGVAHLATSVGLAVIIAGALATVQIPRGVSPSLERDLLVLALLLVLISHGPGALALRSTSSAEQQPGSGGRQASLAGD